jgi:50S ribosomal subunit-associated GTPase HflX
MLVAANKIDVLDDPERLASLQRHLQMIEVPLYAVSAATGEGLDRLLEAMWRQVATARERTAALKPLD